MAVITMRLQSKEIRDALDNSMNDYVKHIMEPRRTECLYAIGDVLEENGYLPTDTSWEVYANQLYFYTYKKDGENLAHYFHEGMIYGPNIPIFNKYEYVAGRRFGIGEPYRFVSPKGQLKHPTGEYLKQGPDTGIGVQHWTEAVQEGGELFEEVVERCREILRR